MRQRVLKPAFATGTLAVALGLSLLTPATASATSSATASASSGDCIYSQFTDPVCPDQEFFRIMVFKALRPAEEANKEKKKAFTKLNPTHEKKKSLTRTPTHEKKKPHTRTPTHEKKKSFTRIVTPKKTKKGKLTSVELRKLTRAKDGKKGTQAVFKTPENCQAFANKMAQQDRLRPYTFFKCNENKKGNFVLILS